MDKIKVSGEFSMNVFKIIDGKKHLIESFVDKNLVVDVGKWCLCRVISNLQDCYVNQIGFGEGTSAPDVGDTGLTATYWIRPITSATHSTPTNEVIFNWILPSSEANGIAISEYGLFANGDYLFSRKLGTQVINKEEDIILDGTWKIIFI